MKKVLAAVLAVLMGVMMAGGPVWAETCADLNCEDCVDTTFFGPVCPDREDDSIINKILKPAVNIMSGLVIAAAIIGIIVSGIQYMTAGGNEAQMVKAKNRMVQIAIGLLIWVLMYAVLVWLIPGFNLSLIQ